MDHFAAQRRRLRSLFGVFFAPEVTGTLLPLARPAVRLVSGGEAAVRLGGAPLLPPGEPWPVWRGRPLGHLGTVDFARLPGVPGLPGEGTFAFYYASGLPRPWGDDPGQRGAWRVYTGDLHEVEPPDGAQVFPHCALSAEPFLSLPAPQEPLLQRLESVYSGVLPVYEQLHVAWRQHIWPDDAPVHQLGGWPVLVERPVGPDCHTAATGHETGAAPLSTDELAAAAEEWRLVLQLDSDERLGWHWGEPGRVYFCARRGEPLESAWLTLQATA
ncbi:hypothetical protein GCM10023085_36820 [Actinomadura viridis]|uniref:DUF1963 domain-containing protein n=1 Tax=Actinomadura viridis TaxID=58110 RepID=A0A931GHT4_9ACTN|nr:YwqG family protein [Actinomadura viridis]MBG6087783.1 hypothetical protein [Actinomadura viridis]